MSESVNPTASPKPTPPPKVEPREADPKPTRADETVPGGAYILSGVVVDCNGDPRTDFKVKNGKIVPA